MFINSSLVSSYFYWFIFWLTGVLPWCGGGCESAGVAPHIWKVHHVDFTLSPLLLCWFLIFSICFCLFLYCCNRLNWSISVVWWWPWAGMGGTICKQTEVWGVLCTLHSALLYLIVLSYIFIACFCYCVSISLCLMDYSGSLGVEFYSSCTSWHHTAH